MGAIFHKDGEPHANCTNACIYHQTMRLSTCRTVARGLQSDFQSLWTGSYCPDCDVFFGSFPQACRINWVWISSPEKENVDRTSFVL